MEKRSTHYRDVQKWIEKVIDSCETYQQTLTVKKLISNFQKQLSNNKTDNYSNYLYTVIHPLETMVTSKRQSLMNKPE